MDAHQAPPSLGFSRQEHRSGLPFPSPMHEREKWKWSRSVVSDSSWCHGLQPTRLLCPWDFPGKSTGVGCHCLLQYYIPSIYLLGLGGSYNWNLCFDHLPLVPTLPCPTSGSYKSNLFPTSFKFFFYFIFKLYITVLVLPNIKMKNF